LPAWRKFIPKQHISQKKQNKLAKITALFAEKPLQNTPYYAKVKTLLESVQEIARRAKIIEDFLATRPSINGIFYYIKSEEAKLPPLSSYFLGSNIILPVSYFRYTPSSTAIIANRTYKENDPISEMLSIKKILRNAIIFNYKNEEIRVEFKGK